jgi:hypothetical protein
MSQYQVMPAKDPSSVEPYFIVWCSPDGTNNGSADDTGELQGETISTVTWTVPDGITRNSDNKSAVTIHGVSYGINTVCTIWLSGGTDQTNYDLACTVVTSAARWRRPSGSRSGSSEKPHETEVTR